MSRVKLTPEVLRAARGFLDWSRADLAEQIGLSKAAVFKIEAKGGHAVMRPSTEQKIIEVFRREGLYIIPEDKNGGAGIRKMKVE